MTRRAYWTCQLAGWAAYAALNVVLSAAFGSLTGRDVLGTLGVSALGLGATHALRGVARARGWLALPVGPLALRMVPASVAAAASMVAVVMAVVAVFDLATPEAPPGAVAFLALVNWSILVLGWSALYVGVHLVDRWRQAEHARAHAEAERWRLQSAVTEAELRALQAQVHPHFLFNSLNTVRALVALDPARAQQAVTDLADLLRYSLAAGRRPTVPLGDELDAVEAYLALERLRFEHRLTASVEADPDALAVEVPTLVVQTLVENGIKHGVSQRPEGGALRVRACRAAGAVRVTVESPGRLDPDGRSESGIGLANAAERLRRLCAEATLTVRQSDADTVTAEVLLPVGEPPVTHSPPASASVPARLPVMP